MISHFCSLFRGNWVTHFTAEPLCKPPLDFTLSSRERNANLVVCGPQLSTNRSSDDANTEEIDLSQFVVAVMSRMMLDDVRAEVLHS